MELRKMFKGSYPTTVCGSDSTESYFTQRSFDQKL